MDIAAILTLPPLHLLAALVGALVLLGVLVWWWAGGPASTAPKGTVEYVYDGDTLAIDTTHHGRIVARLWGMDAPESDQPGGAEATAALRRLVHRRVVAVRVVDRDRYGRIVARVHIDDVDVSREMIRMGHAWVYRQYTRDSTLYRAEREAKHYRRGLWRHPRPTPPWVWRRTH